MNNALEIRKVIVGIILAIAMVCGFLFIKGTLAIDWGGGILTNLRMFVALIILLVMIFFHIFYRTSSETNKLSWTAILTVLWLSLIIFYPFKDPTNEAGGAVGFFALIGGLAVCVLWVRFFSDEIIA